nr:MAG TPA: hypothetical protein [Caudoviricetes sp.]
MYQLCNVDAFYKIQAWEWRQCKKHHGLLPTLRQKDDSDAVVRQMRTRSRRMERGRNMLRLP